MVPPTVLPVTRPYFSSSATCEAGSPHAVVSSSRSNERTSPIERWSRSATRRARSCIAGEEHQLELADLDLVAVLQHRLVDALPVDVGPIQRPDVLHRVAVALAEELGVAPRHR